MKQSEEINIRDTMKLSVTLSEKDSAIIIFHLKGFLDTYNSPDFQDIIIKYKDKGYRKFVFICDEMKYISSVGIASFTNIVKLLRQQGGDLMLVNLQPKVKELFTLLGFTNFFMIVDCTFEDIIDNFNSSSQKSYNHGTFHFPVVIKCPYCKFDLQVDKPGSFQCTECKQISSIDDNGHIIFS